MAFRKVSAASLSWKNWVEVVSTETDLSFSQLDTWDCEATLTDTQVIEMCASGYLFLEAAVPDAINRRVIDFLSGNIAIEHQPTELLFEDWFVENVILNPAAAGAIRSLLGRNFHLPKLMSNHRTECPQPAQNWHMDGAPIEWTPELNFLHVFYYPQDTPAEMGPTEILPGSHLMKNGSRAMPHFGQIRNGFLTSAPAGSIFLTPYKIWHRRAAATGTGVRHLLKYFYWRTQEPQRDWIREDINFRDADFSGYSKGMGDAHFGTIGACEMYCWLCGKGNAFKFKGGQAWPLQGNRKEGPFWGYPKEMENA